jgi:hypothetical protein
MQSNLYEVQIELADFLTNGSSYWELHETQAICLFQRKQLKNIVKLKGSMDLNETHISCIEHT